MSAGAGSSAGPLPVDELGPAVGPAGHGGGDAHRRRWVRPAWPPAGDARRTAPTGPRGPAAPQVQAQEVSGRSPTGPSRRAGRGGAGAGAGPGRARRWLRSPGAGRTPPALTQEGPSPGRPGKGLPWGPRGWVAVPEFGVQLCRGQPSFSRAARSPSRASQQRLEVGHHGAADMLDWPVISRMA